MADLGKVVEEAARKLNDDNKSSCECLEARRERRKADLICFREGAAKKAKAHLVGTANLAKRSPS